MSRGAFIIRSASSPEGLLPEEVRELEVLFVENLEADACLPLELDRVLGLRLVRRDVAIHHPEDEDRVEAVQKNKPGQLVFLIPASVLPPSNPYRLQVRARINGDTDPRVGELTYELTVVVP